MRRYIYIASCALVSMLSYSCSENETADVQPQVADVELMTITAVREGFDGEDFSTKTVRQMDGSVFWNVKDRISLFYGKNSNGGSRFTCTAEETSEIAEFAGIDPALGVTAEGMYWAVYPYSKDNECDGNSVTITLPSVQMALDGSFANDLFPTIGISAEKTIPFYNVCGGVKFSVAKSGIKSVCFKSNGGEKIAGRVKVVFGDNGRPVVQEYVDGVSEVTLVAPNGGTFEVGRYYYFVLLPGALETGFTMTFLTDDGREGEYIRKSEVAVKRSVFGVLDEIDEYVGSWNTASVVSGGWDRGSIYLGLMGFNDDLYKYDFGKLSDETKDGYCTFIDNLQVGGATVLYYSVDHAIDVLQKANYPKDIQDISLIIFTDGMDEGSIMMTDKYLYEEEYLEAISVRITSEKIADLPLTSYTVALRGNIESSNLSYFRNNLEKLASSSENATDFADMDEVSAKFEELANQISRTNYVQTIPLQINGKSQGTKIRFTLDGAASATASKIYIEGVFNIEGEYIDGVFQRTGYSLKDVVYCGLTSSSGNAVFGEKSGVKVVYTFEGLRRSDGELIETDNIKLWTYIQSSSSWQSTNENVLLDGENGIVNEKQSTAIMLVLDCSNSLNNSNNDFGRMQEAAKEFIAILYENAVDENAVASVSLDRYAASIPVGGELTLTTTVLPTTALDRDVIWSSNNTAVATVDNSGKITAVSKGSAYIYAITEDGAKTAVCLVDVPQYAESVCLDKTAVTLYTGENVSLGATVLPEDTSDKTLVWSSSNTSVACVDQEGKVTALKAGNAVISAKSVDGSGLRATCSVTVRQHVTGVTLDVSSLVLAKGSTKTLMATVLPSDASDKSMTWKSSDETVATVDDYGVVSGVAKGTTVIGVTTDDGGYTAYCELKVVQLVESINMNESELTLYTGENAELSVEVQPLDASDNEVSWSSSDVSVATVDQNGKVAALKAGSAVIYAEAADGSGVKASCSLTVKQHVTGVSLSSTSINLSKGKTKTLTATISPSNATDKSVTWTSSDESVATVQSGKVTAVGYGTTIVSVMTTDGEFSASCEIIVSLSTSPIDFSLAVKKDGVRYYVTRDEYDSVDLSEYDKEGLVLMSSSSTDFILDTEDYYTMTHSSSGTVTHRLPCTSLRPSISSWVRTYQLVTFNGAAAYGVMPDHSQASYIFANFSLINEYLVAYGGTALSSTHKYWSSYFTGARYYYFGYSLTNYKGYDTTGSTTCRARAVINL